MRSSFNDIRGAATFGKFNKHLYDKEKRSLPGPGQYNGNFKTITRNSPN